MRNHIIRLLACCVCLFPLFKVTAYDFIYNNVAYRFNPDSVSVYVTYKSKGSVVNYNSAIITIPETVVYKAHRYKVTAIGDSAFHYSMQLSGIKMSDNVRSIGRAAFWGCGLFTVTLSDSLTTIDDDAFYDCTLLRKITIPASVTHIGEKAFAACNKMSSIEVSSENAVYDSRDNCNAIIETATNTLLSGCSTTVIPSSVTAIGDYAFDHMGGFNLIIIPNSVRSIGNSSFRGIGSLSLALLGDSVESLGDYAFADCPNLKTMRLSKSLNRVGKYAFYNDNGLDLTLSANVEAGPMRFSGGTLNLLADVTALGSIYVAPDSIYSLANTPPECDENTFLSYDAVLHVQPSAVDAYRNDDIWSRFTIVADDAVQPVDSLYFVRDSLLIIPVNTVKMDYVMCPSSVPYKMFWYSSNPDVAEVDSEGNVVAKKPGETDIIVACADKYAICHVTDDDYSITVTVNVHDLVLSLGNKATLSLSSTPIQRDFIVENTDSTVVQATISYIRSHYFCEIIALKPGKTTLVFRVEGNNVAPDTCQVTVGRPDGDVTGDGHVDVDDVNALLNVILDLVDNPLAENLDFYDLDKNGAVDIEDVNKLINIILGFSTSSPN